MFDGMALPVTISLGIGTMSDQVRDAATLVKQAETYLRMAKYAGGGCIAGEGIKRLRA
jgi:GGDEF domain-containing protein